MYSYVCGHVGDEGKDATNESRDGQDPGQDGQDETRQGQDKTKMAKIKGFSGGPVVSILLFWKDRKENHAGILATKLCIDILVYMS